MVIVDLKERLLNGEITFIAWHPKENMRADLLSKEMKLPDDLEDILLRNNINLPDTTVNDPDKRRYVCFLALNQV